MTSPLFFRTLTSNLTLQRAMVPPLYLQAQRATVTDLPPELLLEIVSHLDNATLIQFSLICKHTHQLGLQTFFSHNKIATDGVLTLYNAAAETLPALRIALFVRRFQGISYFFTPETKRTVCDVHHMTCLVHRLSFGLEYLELVFSRTPSQELEAEGIDGKSWFGRLARLFNAALEKGCVCLSLEGGEGTNNFYRWVAPEFQLDNGNEEEESEVDPIQHSRLNQIRIFSDMALCGPFYGWMLSTLRGASSTLTKLNMRLRTVPTATWGSFMRSLHLPLLRHLELVNFSSDGADCNLSFVDLHFFLSHHSSITDLVIDGLQAPPAVSDPLELPQLRSIGAGSEHLSFFLGSDQNHCLEEVKSPTFDTKFTYKGVDQIFEAILPLGGPISLCLCLPQQPGLEEWLLRPASAIASLTCVSTLDLSTASCVNFSPGAVAALPGWLCLFPRLTLLKIFLFSQAEREALENQGMMRRMARTCKNLNTLQTFYRTYDLRRFRDDAGEGCSSPSSNAS